jgi:hypothetical protein
MKSEEEKKSVATKKMDARKGEDVPEVRQRTNSKSLI